jgi:iporin
MLTDSEMEGIINGSDAMKNMFVYQYDNVPELEQRPPSGRRGILRRTNTTTNTPTRVTSANVQKQKRYSMLDQPKSPQGQPKSEKRKSLQETNFHYNDLEEYFNNIGGTKNFANRLPNYMKARDDIRNDSKDLNQLLTELELNKALSNKLNYEDENDVDIEEIEARLKAESILNETVDRSKLRSEVSKNLTSRKVSFNHHPSPTQSPMKKTKAQQQQQHHLQAPEYEKKFTTPPNSPQMSQLVDKKQSPVDKKQRLEKEKQDKIQSNRFKRLQIQWELLSKEQESQVLETKSNVTTPTGLKCQSKIPRPVSYPNSKWVLSFQNHENFIYFNFNF